MEIGKCGGVSEANKPTRLWRNGMDFVPKKTYPPDYSNVPSVRDWQMSPFGRERFDLDEIQRAEKKGFKGRFELEKLKAMYLGEKDKKESIPTCSAEREKSERYEKENKIKCSSECYRPYGPSLVPSLSCSRSEFNKPSLYTYSGSSFSSSFQFKTPAPETVSSIPRQDFERPIFNKVYKNVYIPYGPSGKLRKTPQTYIPMGPTLLPVI